MSRIRVNSLVNKDDTGGVTFLKGGKIPAGQIFKVEGGLTAAGIMTATSFIGDGSALTNLNTITASRTYGLALILDPLPFRV
tara:strand:+ start:1716 stop:1961 length:246 start_codon:yes stop_codon:yes gene_type:complete